MIRIGVDFGGTKIEAAALDPHGQFQARVRVPTPPAYEDRLHATREVVAEAERQAGVTAPRIGVGGPGSPSHSARRRRRVGPPSAPSPPRARLVQRPRRQQPLGELGGLGG